MNAERAQELLAAERQRIERALADLQDPTLEDDTSTEEAADHGTDLYERELEDGLRAQLRRELQALLRAEQRLAEGTYGLSVESGEPIPEERLEAYPLAERTVDEERRLQRGL
jgi:RNA polymerase-binding transcription factor